MNFGVSLHETHTHTTHFICETFLGDYRLLSPALFVLHIFFFFSLSILSFLFFFFGNNLWHFELLLLMNSVPKHFKVIIFGGIFLACFVQKSKKKKNTTKTKYCARMHKFRHVAWQSFICCYFIFN